MQLELGAAGPDPVDPAPKTLNGVASGSDGQPAPPSRLSPSGASTFEQCPRRWRFRYVERLPERPGRPALLGTFAHRVLELLLQEPSARRTQERAKELARSQWPEFRDDDDYQALELDREQAFRFRWQAWKAIEGLWALEDPAAVEVKSTEAKVIATLGDSALGDVPFSGVLDRLDEETDGLVVTDYKSGRAPSPRLAAERLRQVLLYAAAVAADGGKAPVRARLYYLGQKVVPTDVNEATLSDAVEKFAATWAGIKEACEADSFDPRPGRLCEYCSFLDRCPDGRADVDRRADERAAEEESLLRLAGPPQA